MPYYVVEMYVEQMPATVAEWKLEMVEAIMVANAAKKNDRDRVLNEWRRIAEKGKPIEHDNKNGVPEGFGVRNG